MCRVDLQVLPAYEIAERNQRDRGLDYGIPLHAPSPVPPQREREERTPENKDTSIVVEIGPDTLDGVIIIDMNTV